MLLQDLLRGCSECASSYVQGIILFGVLCSSKADDDWMNPILAASNITNPDSPVSREACYEIRKIGQKLINDEFETWVEDFKLKDRVICLYETLAVPKYHNLVGVHTVNSAVCLQPN